MSHYTSRRSTGRVPPESERFRLARLARDAALRTPGVAATDIGPTGTFITVAGSDRVEGVICVATTNGGYEVTLRLVCQLVPLPQLGEQIKAAIATAAAIARIQVDSVGVHVAGLDGMQVQ